MRSQNLPLKRINRLIIKIQVAEKYIFEEESKKRIFRESTGLLTVVKEEPVQVVVKAFPRENLSSSYLGLDPLLISRMETLLFAAVPLPHPRQPEEESDNVKKLVKAGVVLIGAFALYKFVAKPLYFKVREWWGAKPKT